MFAPLMENGWALLFTTNNLSEAELMKVFLDENGIIAVVLNKQSSPHLIGEIEVYVKSTDFLIAKQLISKQQEN